MDLTLAEVARDARGVLDGGDAAAIVRGFSFDSRAIEPGQCFVAIQESRDGHDFVADAFAHGAAAALVARRPEGVAGPLVVVDDPLDALAHLAGAARDRLPHATVVGVTGSAGKTSTKDLVAAAVGRRLEAHANAASFNNEIGLPVTLLATPPGTDVLVLEMGERFPGDVAHLAAIARPAIGIVTNVGLAHAEHLGGPDGVIAVMAELLEALPADGLAVLNADSAATPVLRERTAAPVLTAGHAADADVRVTAAAVDATLHPTLSLATPWGAIRDVRLGVRGEHQAGNAALAAAVALHLGVTPEDVALGLADAGGAHWRMQLEHTAAGVTVLNDAYNASPDAMAAALRSFAHLPIDGRRIAVLGAMLELGDESAAAHHRVGALAAETGIHTAVVVTADGAAPLAAAARASGVDVVEVEDADAATAAVLSLVRPGDGVLVKASRRVGLERVAAALDAMGQEVAS